MSALIKTINAADLIVDQLRQGQVCVLVAYEALLDHGFDSVELSSEGIKASHTGNSFLFRFNSKVLAP